MAVTPVNYTRKAPDIQVVKFDSSSAEAMEDIRDWVSAVSALAVTTTLQTSMGGLLSWTVIGEDNTIVVRPGDYIGRDSNDRLFKMSQEFLDAFYDHLVP
jgi:hypothetical protein